MQYQEQTHTAIRFYVLEGEPNLAQFSVLETDTFLWQGKTVNFGILGASHFFSLIEEGSIFTEICACATGTFRGETVVLLDKAISDLSNTTNLSSRGNAYTLNYEIVSTQSGAVRMADLLSYNIGEHVLSREFPSTTETEIPVTIIKIFEFDNSLTVSTAHTYPNEDKIVFTKSYISKL